MYAITIVNYQLGLIPTKFFSLTFGSTPWQEENAPSHMDSTLQGPVK